MLLQVLAALLPKVTPMSDSSRDIIDTAVHAGTFATLVTALKAADLVTTLKGTGPFTVFAPNEAAFAKLPPGTIANLVKPENKARLAAILTLHVLPGKIMAADIGTAQSNPVTVNGETISVDGHAGVRVNGAKVVTADIACSNGVIHVIDTVLMPTGGAKAAAA